MNKHTSKKIEILEFVKEMGELLPGIEGSYQYTRRLRLSSRYGPGTFYTTLKRLEKEKTIKRIWKEKNVRFIITEKGRQLLRNRTSLIRRGDGLSTIIIFDIPVEKNRERTIFRRYLLRNGYMLFQKSVLISPNKIERGLKELIEELGIADYITIFSGRIDHIL